MLNDRKLWDHFRSVHFDESRKDLVPTLYTADIPKLVWMFGKWSCFDLTYVLNASKEMIIIFQLFSFVIITNGFGWNNIMSIHELSCTPNEADKLEIVQRPHLWKMDGIDLAKDVFLCNLHLVTLQAPFGRLIVTFSPNPCTLKILEDLLLQHLDLCVRPDCEKGKLKTWQMPSHVRFHNQFL